MNIIDVIKRLDSLAQEANALWLKAESIKIEIAELHGLKKENLVARGIHVQGYKDKNDA